MLCALCVQFVLVCYSRHTIATYLCSKVVKVTNKCLYSLRVSQDIRMTFMFYAVHCVVLCYVVVGSNQSDLPVVPDGTVEHDHNASPPATLYK